MKWDAGAFAKDRNKNKAFQYLKGTRTSFRMWPYQYVCDMGVLLATPDVTWTWLSDVFDMPKKRLWKIWRETKHLHHLGMENMLSVIESDALIYMRDRRPQTFTPRWVIPFILDDKNKGMSVRELRKKWGITKHLAEQVITPNKVGVIGNVFHSGRKQRWRGDLGGRL